MKHFSPLSAAAVLTLAAILTPAPARAAEASNPIGNIVAAPVHLVAAAGQGLSNLFTVTDREAQRDVTAARRVRPRFNFRRTKGHL
ncbi:MAG: hypothetical protein AAF333_01330 [Planctomycetota bacterium]